MYKELKLQAIQYFESFSCKDLGLIEGILSSEVILKDWDICAEGKQDVLSATKSIFDSVDTINVKPINIYCDKNIVIAELKIIVNNSITEFVVDIITFDVNNKIVSIRAYKG
jgi:hypothetical protein